MRHGRQKGKGGSSIGERNMTERTKRGWDRNWSEMEQGERKWEMKWEKKTN